MASNIPDVEIEDRDDPNVESKSYQNAVKHMFEHAGVAHSILDGSQAAFLSLLWSDVSVCSDETQTIGSIGIRLEENKFGAIVRNFDMHSIIKLWQIPLGSTLFAIDNRVVLFERFESISKILQNVRVPVLLHFICTECIKSFILWSNHCDIGLTYASKYSQVQFVAPHSLAWNKGVRCGDILVNSTDDCISSYRGQRQFSFQGPREDRSVDGYRAFAIDPHPLEYEIASKYLLDRSLRRVESGKFLQIPFSSVLRNTDVATNRQREFAGNKYNDRAVRLDALLFDSWSFTDALIVCMRTNLLVQSQLHGLNYEPTGRLVFGSWCQDSDAHKLQYQVCICLFLHLFLSLSSLNLNTFTIQDLISLGISLIYSCENSLSVT